MCPKVVCGGSLRAKRVGEGTGYRPFGRVVLGGVLAALLAGCGDQTKPVTVVTSAASLKPAPSTVTVARPVPGRVISTAKRSVLPVSCSGPNAADGFVGTGFRVSHGVVTASHVVAACPPATTISFGYATFGTVSIDARLMTWHSSIIKARWIRSQTRTPIRRRCGRS